MRRAGQQTPQSNFGGGASVVNRNPSDIFPAMLTAVSGGLYSWNVQFTTAPDYAGWDTLVGDLAGTDTANPAFEPNDVAIDVSTPVLAFLQRAYLDTTLGWVYVIVSTGGGTGSGSD